MAVGSIQDLLPGHGWGVYGAAEDSWRAGAAGDVLPSILEVHGHQWGRDNQGVRWEDAVMEDRVDWTLMFTCMVGPNITLRCISMSCPEESSPPRL